MLHHLLLTSSIISQHNRIEKDSQVHQLLTTIGLMMALASIGITAGFIRSAVTAPLAATEGTSLSLLLKEYGTTGGSTCNCLAS